MVVYIFVGFPGWSLDVHDWVVQFDVGVGLSCLGDLLQDALVGSRYEVIILGCIVSSGKRERLRHVMRR